MKEQLELHHIDKRLSKGVMVLYKNVFGEEKIFTISGLQLDEESDVWAYFGHDSCLCSKEFGKMILHPLTDLTKEIVHNGERFVPIEKIGSQFECFEIQVIAGKIPTSNGIEISKVSYEVYDWLLSHHFDTDGLIEKGLAIDVNDLKENPYE